MPKRNPTSRLEADLKRIEVRGVNTARRATAKVRAKVIEAYRRGSPLNLKQLLQNELHSIVTDAMVVSHLTATRRVFLQAKRTPLALSFDDMLGVLERQLNADVDALKSQYGTDAFRILNGASDSVERELRQEVNRLISEGLPTKEGVKQLGEKFDSLGLSPKNEFQLETIFRTQTQIAHGAGSWQAYQADEIQEILWGFKYVTTKDDRVRKAHADLEGVTLPKDDPFWEKFWPPNGWNCRCKPTPIFRTVEPKQPPTDAQPDSGFDFNAGEVFRETGTPVTGKTELGSEARPTEKNPTLPKKAPTKVKKAKKKVAPAKKKTKKAAPVKKKITKKKAAPVKRTSPKVETKPKVEVRTNVAKTNTLREGVELKRATKKEVDSFEKGVANSTQMVKGTTQLPRLKWGEEVDQQLKDEKAAASHSFGTITMFEGAVSSARRAKKPTVRTDSIQRRKEQLVEAENVLVETKNSKGKGKKNRIAKANANVEAAKVELAIESAEYDYAYQRAANAEEALRIMGAHEAGHYLDFLGLGDDLVEAARELGISSIPLSELSKVSVYAFSSLGEQRAEVLAMYATGRKEELGPTIRKLYDNAIERFEKRVKNGEQTI